MEWQPIYTAPADEYIWAAWLDLGGRNSFAYAIKHADEWFEAASGIELLRPDYYSNLAARLRKIASGEWVLYGDEGHLVHAADLLESSVAQVISMREAMRPFAELVLTTSGRIPHERLALADWHQLVKAYRASTPNVELTGSP